MLGFDPRLFPKSAASEVTMTTGTSKFCASYWTGATAASSTDASATPRHHPISQSKNI